MPASVSANKTRARLSAALVDKDQLSMTLLDILKVVVVVGKEWDGVFEIDSVKLLSCSYAISNIDS